MSELQRSIEQKRAGFAYECAEKGSRLTDDKNNSKANEYKAYAQKAPALIKTNGLAVTLAFFKAKAKGENPDQCNVEMRTAYGLIYSQIRDWIVKCDLKLLSIDEDFNLVLVEEVIKQESASYRAITLEVLAFLQWLRRFAEGLIKEKTTDGQEK